MLMIMDLQGWGGIHNHSSPGPTAAQCTFTFMQKVRKRKGKTQFNSLS